MFRPLLRGDVLVGPGAGPGAHVDGVWGEVRASGPHDGAGLGIDRDLREPFRRARLCEHGSLHSIEHIQLLSDTLGGDGEAVWRHVGW